MPLNRIGSSANSTHQPEWEPEGGWDNTTSAADYDDGRKVTRYADGTQKQVDKDGRVVIVYGGTEWKQYCECPSLAQWMLIGVLFLQLKVNPKLVSFTGCQHLPPPTSLCPV